MAEFGGNSGGLGKDIGRCDYVVSDEKDHNGGKIFGAFEWNVLGTSVLVVTSLAPRVPRLIRVASIVGSVALGANAALIFKNEINRPPSN